MSRWGADPVVAFYAGGRDVDGRTLDEILAWDNESLESVHDYIQWLFPTRRPSGVNVFAPLVSDDTVKAFERDETLRARLRRALDRMLAFYGLQWNGARIEVDPGRFDDRARIWLSPWNHNHLRLTRIMDSLSTLGLRSEALALQRCLIEDLVGGTSSDRVSPRTVSFWRQAVQST